MSAPLPLGLATALVDLYYASRDRRRLDDAFGTQPRRDAIDLAADLASMRDVNDRIDAALARATDGLVLVVSASLAEALGGEGITVHVRERERTEVPGGLQNRQ